jgi:hypothetical protein
VIHSERSLVAAAALLLVSIGALAQAPAKDSKKRSQRPAVSNLPDAGLPPERVLAQAFARACPRDQRVRSRRRFRHDPDEFGTSLADRDS